MTTEKPTDILLKLPTEKSTEKSTAKLTSKVYQVDQDSLKHRRYCNQPPPEVSHRGRRIRGRRSQEKIIGKDHGRRYGKTNTSESIYKSMPIADDYRYV